MAKGSRYHVPFEVLYGIEHDSIDLVEDVDALEVREGGQVVD